MYSVTWSGRFGAKISPVSTCMFGAREQQQQAGRPQQGTAAALERLEPSRHESTAARSYTLF